MTPEQPATRGDRYLPRRDVSAVPHQGGYAAKRCPLRVQFDHLPPTGVEPLAPSAAERARDGRRHRFEVDIFDELASNGDVVRIGEDARADERRARTAAAMDEGVLLILGGELALDERDAGLASRMCSCAPNVDRTARGRTTRST